jgi:hypothetical protein
MTPEILRIFAYERLQTGVVERIALFRERVIPLAEQLTADFIAGSRCVTIVIDVVGDTPLLLITDISFVAPRTIVTKADTYSFLVELDDKKTVIITRERGKPVTLPVHIEPFPLSGDDHVAAFSDSDAAKRYAKDRSIRLGVSEKQMSSAIQDRTSFGHPLIMTID